MATVLAQQLQAVNLSVGRPDKGRQRGRPSLLYDPYEAADLDAAFLLKVATEGLQQLSRLDPRFEAYGDTLFREDGGHYDREQQSPAQIAKMDASIEAFLGLLSPHLLQPGAFKALEYLVRRYRVNDHNVDALMRCGLAYHETLQFVRLVQVCQLRGGIWTWLEPMQKSGAMLPRGAIVQRCVGDHAVLRFICEAAKEASQRASQRSPMLLLYAALVCELLAAVPQVGEDLLLLLLPYIVAGVGKGVSDDYRMASTMIASQLATRAPLSDQFLSVLLSSFSRQAAKRPEALKAVVLLAITQPQIQALPAKALLRLARVEGLGKQLAAVGARAASLTRLLLLGFAADPGSDTYLPAILDLLQNAPLGEGANTLAGACLAALADADEQTLARLHRVIRALDARYPQEVDAAVNQALKPYRKAVRKVAGGGAAVATGLLEKVQAALQGSLRAPLAATGASLLRALDSPAAEMRIMALQELDRLAGKEGGLPQETVEQLPDVLLRRLADDACDVATAALDCTALLRVPPEPLYDSLLATLQRTSSALMARGLPSEGPHPDSPGQEATVRKVLDLLVGAFARQHPTYAERVAVLLLDQVLLPASARPVSVAAIHAARRLSHPLTQGWGHGGDPQEAGGGSIPVTPAPAVRTRRASKGKSPASEEAASPPAQLQDALQAGLTEGSPGALQSAAVDALAAHMAQKPVAVGAALELGPRAGCRARALLVLALLRAFSGLEESQRTEVATALACISTADWGGLATQKARAAQGEEDTPMAPPERDFSSSEGAAQALAEDLNECGPRLFRQGLLVALERLDLDALGAALPGETVETMFSRMAVLGPPQAFMPVLSALLACLPTPGDASALLADIFAAPTGADNRSFPAHVQERALHQLAQLLADSTSSEGVPSPSLAAPLRDRVFPRALTALTSSARGVRKAALACLEPLVTILKAQETSAGDNSALEDFVNAVRAQKAVIKDDPRGLVELVRHTFEDGESRGQPAPARQSRRKSPKAKETASAASRGLALSLPESKEQMGKYVLSCLPAMCQQGGLPAYRTAQLLLDCCGAVGSEEARLTAAHRALHALLTMEGDSVTLPQGELEIAFLCRLLHFYMPNAVQAAVLKKGEGPASRHPGVGETLLVLAALPGGPTEAPGEARVRSAVLQQATPELYAALGCDPGLQSRLFMMLLRAAANEADEATRGKVRAALAALPLSADAVTPLLLSWAGEGEAMEVDSSPPSKKSPRGKKRSKKSAPSAVEPPADAARPAASPAAAADCIAALGLLQWRHDIDSEPSLIRPLSLVLRRLLVEARQANPNPPVAQAPAPDAEEAGAFREGPDEDTEEAEGLPVAYVMQLALDALRGVVERHARDDALKGLDMDLVVRCVGEAPNGAVRNSALALTATAARQLPAQALQHVIQVVTVVGSSLAGAKDASSHAAGAAALRAVLPAWSAAGRPIADLCSTLVAGLRSCPQNARLPLLTTLLEGLPQEEALQNLFLLLLQEEARDAAGNQPAPGEAGALPSPVELGWARSLATAIFKQGGAQERARALAGLLKQAMEASGKVAHAPLVVRSTAFASSCLQGSSGLSSVGEAAETTEAFTSLLEQCLLQLRVLGKERDELKAAKAATKGVQSLLDALEGAMSSAAHLGALVSLVSGERDSLVRSALRLFIAKVGSLQEEGTSKEAPVAEAALGMCAEAARIVPAPQAGGAGPATRQLAMAALGHIAAAFGAQHPQPLLAVLPPLLAAAYPVAGGPGGGGPRALRASALAAVASITAALGPQAVPALPTVIPAVLQSAGDTLFRLPAAGGGDASEALLVEAGGAVAAIGALVTGVGAFLTPYLDKLLAILLDPRVATCGAASVGPAACRITAALPSVMPARLLLPALEKMLPAALLTDTGGDGPSAAVGLLGLVSGMVGSMDAATVDSAADRIFTLLMQALDTRRMQSPTLTPAGVAAVEQAAAVALTAATMKLNDRRFKPLFLKLLDWASGGPAEGSPQARRTAFFTLVITLAERLRSLFVPYYRDVLPTTLDALREGSEEERGSQPPPGKKRKKRDKKGGQASASAGPDDGDSWRLRLKVVTSLQRVLLYDRAGFLDEDSFHRILPPLVAQLEGEPAPTVLRGLAEDGSWSADPMDDTFGDAVVGALVQMAVTAGSDDLIKPLHHQVLMMTRREGKVRARALRVLAGLVDRLQEEYTSPALLPEALPFLGELLEEPEEGVAEAARTLVARLQQLSGENIENYLKP